MIPGGCFNKYDGKSAQATDHLPILFVQSRMFRCPVGQSVMLIETAPGDHANTVCNGAVIHVVSVQHHFKYLSSCSARIFAEDLASKKSSLISSISSCVMVSFPLILHSKLAGVNSCKAYLQQDFTVSWMKSRHIYKKIL